MIICEKCKSENVDGAKFCCQCGEPLVIPKIEKEQKEPSVLGYYYAKYTGKDDAYYRFVSTDGRKIYIPAKSIGDQNISKEDFVWISERRAKNGKSRYYTLIDPDSKKAWKEIPTLLWQYKKGDTVVGPITEKTDKMAKILISPNIFGVINKSDVDDENDFKNLDKEGLYVYEFIDISNENDKFRTNLKPIRKYEDSAQYRRKKKFIESIEKVNTYSFVLDNLRDNSYEDYDTVQRALGGNATEKKLNDYIEKKLKKQIKDHTLCIIGGKTETVYVDLEIRNVYGVPLAAKLVPNEKKEDTLKTVSISALPASYEMERFVYVDDWKETLDKLAELAAPEEWDFEDETKKTKVILDYYLKFTFYKAKLDGQIEYTDSGEDAVFNTGLVDLKYNDIFCHLKKNTNINDVYERMWEISSFATRESSAGKRINSLFQRFPEAPVYINPKRLDMIYYDTTKELTCDFEHIVEDNLDRLPIPLIKHAVRDENVNSLIPDKGPIPGDVKKKIIENPEVLRALENSLRSAVETAKKYCRWNYKTAIPVYYARSNSISLLLPLSGLVKEGQIDVALVVERLQNGHYQGQTIFDLHMAYQDARQICRPNSEWLKRG